MNALPVGGIHHVAVQVKDLARAEAFYCKALGLKLMQRWPAEGGGDRALWVDAGGGSFLALERAAPDAKTAEAEAFQRGDAGWLVVALRIARADRAEWEQRLLERGVTIDRRTKWTLFCRDPEGNRIGLSHHPDDAEL